MPELVATLNAVYKREERSQKFMAAIQGIDIDKVTNNSEKATTLQQIHARVQARLTGDLEKAKAIEYGFTPEVGLGYASYGINYG
jgi:hypothetical protein